MILRRMGNKTKIAKLIYQYFPKHTMYIEPFFGAGGMFFNKPKAQYNILNDIDDNIFNLFQVISLKKQEFKDAFIQMPSCESLFKYWLKNQETDPIRKALRFLMLSNYAYMGKGSMKFGFDNTSEIILKNLDITCKLIRNCQFTNTDFRKVISKISIKDVNKHKVFIYCDPPYLNTQNNYRLKSKFTEKDSEDLFNMLTESEIKFAVSEFDNPFIIEQAKARKLEIIVIGERQNAKNRRTEILIRNYKSQGSLFDK